MSPFHLTICTPQGSAFDGEIDRLIARTTNGDAAILHGHIPYAAVLTPGALRILANGTECAAHCGGGILTATQERALLLTDTLKWD